MHRAGVPLATAMRLMRHTDARLTLVDYCDEEQLETVKAIESLPAVPALPALPPASKANQGANRVAKLTIDRHSVALTGGIGTGFGVHNRSESPGDFYLFERNWWGDLKTRQVGLEPTTSRLTAGCS